jgi:hypothetical protein
MPTLTTPVIVLTKTLRIEGNIDLIPGARLTDFMNKSQKFMVITKAEVSDRNDKNLIKSEFLNVLVENIEVILPAENLL